jgi:hypothetical protein
MLHMKTQTSALSDPVPPGEVILQIGSWGFWWQRLVVVIICKTILSFHASISTVAVATAYL